MDAVDKVECGLDGYFADSQTDDDLENAHIISKCRDDQIFLQMLFRPCFSIRPTQLHNC